MNKQKRVLITGAAGRIGRVLWHSLKSKYKLRLMFHKTVLPVEEEYVIADITKFETLPKAMKGVDAVVHLADKLAQLLGKPSSRKT